MKKKIIFMVKNMNIGGTEKALLNMIAEMPKDEYDITIFMLEEFGGFLNNIPSSVNVEYFNGFEELKDALNNPPLLTAKGLLKEGKVIKACQIAALHILSKVIKDRSHFFRYLLKDHTKLNQEYDIAVAYAGPMDLISYFVVHKMKAAKKIQWIHFDISKIGFDQKFASKLYPKFDEIFAVSDEAKKMLVNQLPELKEKINTFYNVLSKNQVITLATNGKGFDDHYKGVRILTVGRLSKEKGQDLSIPVLAKLKENEYNVKWYCLGEGHARKEYEQLIKQYEVEDDFILLGSQSNPYPFMKECDVYVQSSRHEGYCITLAEARCFSNPIVCTKFTGAEEQITHNHTGLIVNFDEDEMYQAIKKILDDEILKNKLKNNLSNEIVDSTKEIEKLSS
ncbi:glycosyltransferase [Alkalihalobacillus sp. MEB130]|uniref:glycosyltransferase n=1 Tax=Alkalihalobacillus sp. MEB130 TaxID=2976704 RepID=UPI0028DF9F76|nr:glycosyltransferase [Alkalihalobacillus sp. MEB130]MDT8861094.1 glycosyltransferase [Alkalihalobacillus sp. MEB130]